VKTVSTFNGARELADGRVGLVPTMGYLHEGHLSLIETARSENDTVVVSVFVNPMQFGQQKDLETYPRDAGRDSALASDAGADIMFTPSVEHMYPFQHRTVVSVGTVAEGMEGAHRPGHFDGVATVVAKLFAGLQPDVAYFGRKDAQQLAVVRALVADLAFPVSVRGISTVREADGLALSSRNVKIDETNRATALSLSTSLMLVADAFEAGERKSRVLRDIVRQSLALSQQLAVDHVEVARSADARTVDAIDAEAFVAVAGTVGGVRLIDNVTLDPSTGTADRGTRLTRPSILYGGS